MSANGRCTVCKHTDRARIELLLADGASQRSVARKYSLSFRALSRHWTGHVSEEKRAALLIGPVQRAALAAKVAEESASVLDHHRVTRAGLYSLFSAAMTAGDRTGGALLAGKLTEVNNSIARLTGQLANSPLVQINNTQQTNFFTSDPAFAAFQAQLITALRAFPDARAAIIAVFERIELAVPERPQQPAALEHVPDPVTSNAGN